MEQHIRRYGYINHYKTINQYIVSCGMLAERLMVRFIAEGFYVGRILQHGGVGCCCSSGFKKVGRGVFTVLMEYFKVGFAELEFMGIPLGLFYRGRGIAAEGFVTGSFSQQAAGE